MLKITGIAHVHENIHKTDNTYTDILYIQSKISDAVTGGNHSLRTSVNHNQGIQLKVYFYSPNNRHFCKCVRSVLFMLCKSFKHKLHVSGQPMLFDSAAKCIYWMEASTRNGNLLDCGTLKSLCSYTNAHITHTCTLQRSDFQ